jgi:hypothetical protein
MHIHDENRLSVTWAIEATPSGNTPVRTSRNTDTHTPTHAQRKKDRKREGKGRGRSPAYLLVQLLNLIRGDARLDVLGELGLIHPRKERQRGRESQKKRDTEIEKGGGGAEQIGGRELRAYLLVQLFGSSDPVPASIQLDNWVWRDKER